MEPAELTILPSALTFLEFSIQKKVFKKMVPRLTGELWKEE